MSGQTTPLYTMSIASSESLLQELVQSLATVRTTQQKNTRKYQNWRAVANNPATQNDQMMGGNMLFNFLLEGLFGMPLFAGLSDMTQGMAHMGAMSLTDREQERRVVDPYSMDLADAAYENARARNKAQEKQLQMWQHMAMLMLMAMLQQQAQQGEKSGDADGLVPDILRHPTMARFKQNRASVACIRTMFQRQADAVTPSYQAPKYICA